MYFRGNNRKSSVIRGAFLLFVAAIDFLLTICCGKEYTSMYQQRQKTVSAMIFHMYQ